MPWTIYKGVEGWQGEITVGLKPNGEPDRRKRRGQSEAIVRTKIADLYAQAKAGKVTRPGVVPKTAEYLKEWLNHPDHEWRYSTEHSSYEWAVLKYLVPGLGEWRLDQIPAKTLEDFFKGLRRTAEQEQEARVLGIRPQGLADASVHGIFRVLRSALNDAVRRGLIPRNPIELMTWVPKNVQVEFTPLEVAEVQRIIDVCRDRRNGTRWTIGLPLGLRQGEALGMPWWTAPTSTRDRDMGVDLAGGWMHVGRKAQRHRWQHGCTDPAACAKAHCKTKPCPTRWQHGCGKPAEQCTKHRVDRCPQRKPRPGCAISNHRNPQTCARVCAPDCTGHARSCPRKRGGGIVFEDPKTRSGNRPVALAARMVDDVTVHKAAQDRERRAAGDMWAEHDLVWCQPNGRPIDARADWEEWKQILRLAEVRDARVHDGRHTAATMLLLQGVDDATVMAVMGWSDRRMLARYQHVIAQLRQEATRRVTELLYGAEVQQPKKAKKKKAAEKKRRKQEKLATVDTLSIASATSGTTRNGIAPVISLFRKAKIS
ncbi:tyrosine-type recombinase/integrase [Actinoplanes derwentensis]|uniref:tyrosine-type recombinase/integrase n=1 Tax=Actinoplanes derwentensis TaxID=113562 RepID=UPI001940CEE1|nr:tyrosine-type recombinase/integrase [Actinoplanes derwentensis]